MLPGLRHLVDAVHGAGGRIAMQIAHGGLFANSQVTGQGAIGPSVMPTENGPVGREMTPREIGDTVRAFAEAAARAQRAGFDAVQVHAAHGYLLAQFLSPFFNRRTDEYGGSPENRARMAREVIQEIRKAVGSHYPVLVKLNSEDLLGGGATVEEMAHAAGVLEKAGVDAIEVSGGTVLGLLSGNPAISFSPVGRSDVFWEMAAAGWRKAVSVPVILVGGIRALRTAERLVVEGVTDYVALSRPLIREPDLIKRWHAGDTRDSACVSDDACLQPGLEGKGVGCVHLRKTEAVAAQA